MAFFAAFATVIAAVLRSGRRLDHRIDRLDTRIDKLDTKIDGVEQRLTAKVDGVEQRLTVRISGVEQRLDARIDGVDAKMDSVHHQLVEFRLETREEFGRVHAQLGRHEEKLAHWERFIWARTAPELLGAEAEQSHSITPKAAG